MKRYVSAGAGLLMALFAICAMAQTPTPFEVCLRIETSSGALLGVNEALKEQLQPGKTALSAWNTEEVTSEGVVLSACSAKPGQVNAVATVNPKTADQWGEWSFHLKVGDADMGAGDFQPRVKDAPSFNKNVLGHVAQLVSEHISDSKLRQSLYAQFVKDWALAAKVYPCGADCGYVDRPYQQYYFLSRASYSIAIDYPDGQAYMGQANARGGKCDPKNRLVLDYTPALQEEKAKELAKNGHYVFTTINMTGFRPGAPRTCTPLDLNSFPASTQKSSAPK